MDIFVKLAEEVSAVGSSPAIFVIGLLVTFYLVIKKDFLHTAMLGLSSISGLYSSLLKYIFNEQRPAGYVSGEFIPWDRILKSEVYSFPSTHTVLYTAFFGYLLYLSFKLKGVNKTVRYTARVFCLLLIASVGVSRVLLGAHYVKDVVFGYIFGLLYLGVVIYVEKFLEQRPAKRLPKHKVP